MMYKFLNDVKEKILPTLNDEIQGVVSEWVELREISESHVCIHTLGVVYCITIIPEYQKCNKNEQNLLKWSGLLHDIKK